MNNFSVFNTLIFYPEYSVGKFIRKTYEAVSDKIWATCIIYARCHVYNLSPAMNK